jgi:hypothetical protein
MHSNDTLIGSMILFGESPPRKAISEFTANYHLERNYQGLGKPPDHSGRDGNGNARGHPTPETTGWDAELLLPVGSLSRDRLHRCAGSTDQPLS